MSSWTSNLAVTARALLVVAALFGLLWGGRALLFEKVEEEVEVGFRGEAQVNPFFALQRLYSRLGVETHSDAKLRLPPYDQVLMVAAQERGAKLAKISAWVHAGGHLVIIPSVNGGSEALLEAFGMRLFEGTYDSEDEDPSQPEMASARPSWPRLHADTEQVAVLRSEGIPDAAWTLTVGVDEGRVTAVSHGEFLDNEHLELKDHALIAWQLIAADGTPAGVRILFRDRAPSVWSLIGTRSRPALISLAALLLAVGLLYSRRCGPLLPAPSHDRRHLAEHVTATGTYLWHVGCEEVLLGAQRQALRQRLSSLAAASDDLAALCRQVAAKTGYSAAEVEAALDLGEVRDPQRFTQMIQTLESLRRPS